MTLADSEARALAAWQRCLSSPVGWKHPGDRAAVAQHLIHRAWERGDMRDGLLLADELAREAEQWIA